MKEYFKTDEKLFAFRQKDMIGASLSKGKRLRLIGELEFMDKYNSFFKLESDKYLVAFDYSTTREITFRADGRSYPLAILNLKDNTLSGIGAEINNDLRLGFCKFEDKWVPLVCYGNENKTFTVKNSSLVEAYNSKILTNSLTVFLDGLFNGTKITGDVSKAFILPTTKEYTRVSDYAPQYFKPSVHGDSRFSGRDQDNIRFFKGGDFTQILDDKTMLIRDGVLYETPIYKDNVIEIKE